MMFAYLPAIKTEQDCCDDAAAAAATAAAADGQRAEPAPLPAASCRQQGGEQVGDDVAQPLQTGGDPRGHHHQQLGGASTMRAGGRHVFACAAFGGHPDVVRTLARVATLREEMNTATAAGEYPIHIAARRGHWAVVRALLDCGADVNARVDSRSPKVSQGMTALHWAALTRGGAEIVEDLVASGADKDATTSHSGESPLHLAARRGNHVAVGALLDAGATVTILSRSNLSPLDLAACNNRPAAIDEFLRRGIDPNSSTNPLGYTAIHQAAYHDAGSALEALLRAGCDINAAAANGCTPLHAAAFSPGLTVGRRGVGREGDDDGDSAAPECRSAVRTIIRWRAGDCDARALQIDAVDASGSTPLRVACVHLRERAVAHLLRAGASETMVKISSDSFVEQEEAGRSCATPRTTTCTLTSPAKRSCSAESIARVMAMLSAAPLDRSWRRRGWLALLRARHLRGAWGEFPLSGCDGGRSGTGIVGANYNGFRRGEGGIELVGDIGRRKLKRRSCRSSNNSHGRRDCGEMGGGRAGVDSSPSALRAVVAEMVSLEDDSVFKRIVLFV